MRSAAITAKRLRAGAYIAVLAPLVAAALPASAEDWPVFQHDNRRSAVTDDVISLPLAPAWSHVSPTPPQTAWEGPAKWDAYSGKEGLKSMRNFDPAFFVTIAGGRLYFGSSVDDAAHCLDAATGAHRWSAFADGPVRLPPSIHEGRAFFGSDDGYAYCVDAATGELLWRHRPVEDRVVPVNGKLISLSPIRSGVLVAGGLAYFAASLLPWRPTVLCAVDAATGTADAARSFRTVEEGIVIQGALLASPEHLYALQGRSSPVVFSRESGQKLGTAGKAGGALALLTEDDTLIAGASSQKQDYMAESGATGRDQLASYENANRMLVSAGVAYLQSGSELSAFDRGQYLALNGRILELNPRQQMLEKKLKDAKFNVFTPEGKQLAEELKTIKKEIEDLTAQMPACFRWKVECAFPHALILAGDTLFAGGTNAVAAYRAATGEKIWEAAVEGAAHGLAAANGRLYVSTDRGHIVCFAAS